MVEKKPIIEEGPPNIEALIEEEKERSRAAAPKKRSPAPKGRPSTKSLEQDIGAMLVTGNLLLAPFIKDDMLDDLEIVALAKAIDKQAQRSPRFRRYLSQALETAGGANIATVMIIIAGRRMARHSVIDPSWDIQLRAYLQLTNMDVDTNDPDAMAKVAAAMIQEADATTNDATNGTTPAA